MSEIAADNPTGAGGASNLPARARAKPWGGSLPVVHQVAQGDRFPIVMRQKSRQYDSGRTGTQAFSCGLNFGESYEP